MLGSTRFQEKVQGVPLLITLTNKDADSLLQFNRLCGPPPREVDYHAAFFYPLQVLSEWFIRHYIPVQYSLIHNGEFLMLHLLAMCESSGFWRRNTPGII